jgi:hypothetical protein
MPYVLPLANWAVELHVAATSSVASVQVPVLGRQALYLWACSGSVYGPNLWIQPLGGMSHGTLNAILWGTTAGVTYEIQSASSPTGPWQTETMPLAADGQEFTPFSVAAGGRSVLFLRARSWVDSENTGIPDWWWYKYVGFIGNPYALDPSGDGWSYLQDYQNGFVPGTINAPAAPTEFTAALSPDGTSALLSWMPPASPAVTGYNIYRVNWNQNSGIWVTQQIAQVVGNTDAYQDSGNFQAGNPFGGNEAPAFDLGNSTYLLQAVYPGAVSPTVSAMLQRGDPALAVDAKLIRNSTGGWELICPQPPSNAQKLRLTWFEWDCFWDLGSFLYSEDIAITNLQAGVYVIPDAEITNHVQPVEGASQIYTEDLLWVQGVDASGRPGVPVEAGFVNEDAPYFVDGRQHMLQNLTFEIRAATRSQNFPLYEYMYMNSPWYGAIQLPSGTNYVESGFLHMIWEDKGWSPGGNEGVTFVSMNNLWPFELNYELHESLIDTNAVPDFTWTPDFATVPAPPVLGLPDPYLIQESVTDLADLGLNLSAGGSVLTLGRGQVNLYGMSIEEGWGSTGGIDTNGLPIPPQEFTLDAGDSVTLTNTEGSMQWYYDECGAPQFQYTFTSNYFAPVLTTGASLIGYSPSAANQPYPLPINSGFSGTNRPPFLFASVGQPMVLAGWAKFNLPNGTEGYLGQYFQQAVQANSKGLPTSVPTGVLSPYGEFFPTEPGDAILTTMTNALPDTEPGTATVYVVSLVLDANHDGTMDLSFTGSDQTSTNHPYVFWVNNNYDRTHPIGSDLVEDDVASNTPAARDLYSGVPKPDCEYRDASSMRVIPSQRDLEDFARLWIRGITTNLLLRLDSGSTATLSWGDVGNPNANNPTIDLFGASDAYGGRGYLTNIYGSLFQTNAALAPYLGRLGPGSNVTVFSNSWAIWRHMIWCGVKPGSGALTLTIYDPQSNVLAQTSQYIQVVDIKQMYERWTVGEDSTNPPASFPSPAEEGVTTPFQYPPSPGTNTTYILLVHDYNLPTWQKDRYAETVFKRLYWQGYQGRFGLFRWPIGNTDPPYAMNFSESNAWSSGTGLLNLLTNLNAQYPGNVFLMAHGFGAIAAGEALSMAGTNQVVNTYIAMQGAVTSDAYDRSAPLRLTNNPSGAPDCYVSYYGIGLPYFYYARGAGAYINYFNTSDYVLTNLWCQYEDSKPDTGLRYSWNGQYFQYRPSRFTIFPTTLTFPTNTYQIFSYCGVAWRNAIGAQPKLGAQFLVSSQVDLSTPVNGYYFGGDLKDHNDQFLDDCATRWPFWYGALKSMQLKP